jgi:hypothetical protein
MPRWASRLTLAVEEVRVERLLDITEDDARAEGVERDPDGCDGWRGYGSLGIRGGYTWTTARDSFADLWDSINADRAPWASNPWVWVVRFSRVTP